MFKAGDLNAAVEKVLTHSREAAELARVGRAARTYVTNERQWKHNIRQLIDFRDSLKAGKSA